MMRYISAFTLLVVFFLPATGIFYVRHTCHLEGISNFMLNAENECCEHNSNPFSCCQDQDETEQHEGSEQSCALTDGEVECCTFSFHYIKVESRYVAPVNNHMLHSVVAMILPAATDDSSNTMAIADRAAIHHLHKKIPHSLPLYLLQTSFIL